MAAALKKNAAPQNPACQRRKRARILAFWDKRDENNFIFKNEPEKLLKTNDRCQKTKLNEPENEAEKLLKIRSCGKNKPKNGPGHVVETTGQREFLHRLHHQPFYLQEGLAISILSRFPAAGWAAGVMASPAIIAHTQDASPECSAHALEQGSDGAATPPHVP
jgi:hypothetical protein